MTGWARPSNKTIANMSSISSVASTSSVLRPAALFCADCVPSAVTMDPHKQDTLQFSWTLCVIHLTGLLLIRSPKFSRDFGFYGFAAEQDGFTYTLIPTLTLTITPKLFITLTTTLTLTLNPSPKQSNSCLTSLSSDQNRFLPITLQGSIFTLRHGWFGISVQKYTDSDHFHTLRTFSQEFS